MKFFIDTANLDQIKEAQNLGVLDGVTTNPSLMAKEGITGREAILKHYVAICEIVTGDVSAEVIEAFAGLTGKSLRWVIAKVDGSDINLVQTGVRTSTLEELNAVLGDDPCFIVFDYEATRADGSTLCKTCFICYAPDSCTSMQRKFELQNFKACVEAKINFAKEMQINDKADLTE